MMADRESGFAVKEHLRLFVSFLLCNGGIVFRTGICMATAKGRLVDVFATFDA